MVRLKKIEKYIHIHSTIITDPYIIKNWNCRYFVLICLESNNDARKVRDSKKLTIITVIFRCHIIVTSYNSWFFLYSLIHLSIIRKEGIFLKIFDSWFLIIFLTPQMNILMQNFCLERNCQILMSANWISSGWSRISF